jgi:C1A family cysteine protease
MKKTMTTALILSCFSVSAQAGGKLTLDEVVELYKNPPKKAIASGKMKLKSMNSRLPKVIPLSDLLSPEKLEEVELKRRRVKIRTSNSSSSAIDRIKNNIKKSVDLSHRDTEVKTQERGDCTAFAMIAALENKINNKKGDLSEEHLWKTYEKPYVHLVLRSAAKNFITTEKFWPYKQSPRSGYNFRDNAHTMLKKFIDLDSKLGKTLESLNRGNPVFLAKMITEDLHSGKTVVDANSPLVEIDNEHAGHAMAIVGYILNKDVPGGGFFKIKNSWGPRIGDQGYQYIPFNHCTERNLCVAMYSIEKVQSNFTKKNKDAPFNLKEIKIEVKADENEKDSELVNFSLSLKASKTILDQVEKVVYDIHPSFGGSSKFQAKSKSDKFKTQTYISYAHGWETMGTKVFLKNGKVLELNGSVIPGPKKIVFGKKDFKLNVRTLRTRSGLKFILFLEEKREGALGIVKNVIYDTHPTFGKHRFAKGNVLKKGLKSPLYQTFAQGWKTGGAKIKLTDGRTIRLDGIIIQ